MLKLSKNNLQEAFAQDKPLVLKFFAPWCQPCKMFEPVMENIARNLPNVKFYEVNLELMRDIANEMNVSSVPTTVLIHEGREVDRFIGIKDGKGIYEWLNSHLPEGWNDQTVY